MSGANYCCSYGFRSLNSKRSTNVTEGANMEITSLALASYISLDCCRIIEIRTIMTVPVLSSVCSKPNLNCRLFMQQYYTVSQLNRYPFCFANTTIMPMKHANVVSFECPLCMPTLYVSDAHVGYLFCMPTWYDFVCRLQSGPHRRRLVQ